MILDKKKYKNISHTNAAATHQNNDSAEDFVLKREIHARVFYYRYRRTQKKIDKPAVFLFIITPGLLFRFVCVFFSSIICIAFFFWLVYNFELNIEIF